jgi:hypothetical protein
MKDLFGSWLSETRRLQREAYGRDLWGLTGEARAQSITNDYAECVIELGEMMQEFPGHKTWVTDRDKIDREAMIGEAVDALHFLGNILTTIQCTDDELTRAYWAKMQKNRNRMASGTYDGVKDKCPECKRELLDLEPSTLYPERMTGRCPEHGRVYLESVSS